MEETPCNEEEILTGSKLDSLKGVQEEKQEKQKTKLPPLSAADWRVYNGMADHMDQFVGVATTLSS